MSNHTVLLAHVPQPAPQGQVQTSCDCCDAPDHVNANARSRYCSAA